MAAAAATAERDEIAERIADALVVTDTDDRPATSTGGSNVQEQVEGAGGSRSVEEIYAAHLARVTTDVRNIQRQKLREILSHNAGCQYLSGLGVDGDTDVEAFKRKVPLVEYEDMEETFNRMADGDAEVANFYTVDPIDIFILSSGTSKGKSKLMPTTRRRYDGSLFLAQLSNWHTAKCYRGMNDGKSMTLIFVSPQVTAPSGILAGAASSNYFKSDMFRKRRFDRTDVMTSPDEVVLCEDYHEAMYCHLVCGLFYAPEVSRISAIFGSTVLAALRVLQSCWQDVCRDIREGTLSRDRVTDPAARRAVLEVLGPGDPARADAVARECGAAEAASGSWDGIVPRLWRNAVVVKAVFTGSQRQYVAPVRRMAGHVQLCSPGYAAAESTVLGINLRPARVPEETVYAVWPEGQYLELLPVDPGGGGGGEETVELADAVVGHEYEPVLTTMMGLYRYKLGDVVKVRSFYNATPEVEFVRRRGVLLSIHDDKTDEGDLQAAVTAAGELLQARAGAGVWVVDYTSCADVDSHPGHYVVFLELSALPGGGTGGGTGGGGDTDPQLLLQECASALDRGIPNEVYAANRRRGIVAPLELRLVQQGTFEGLMLQAAARGSTPQQYKTPRCVMYAEGIQFLNQRVVHKARSSATFSV